MPQPDRSSPDRPLPDCLTRLLGAPGSPAPSPGERVRRPTDDRAAKHGDRATDGAIIRATAYGTAGLVWIGVLWQVVHRLSG